MCVCSHCNIVAIISYVFVLIFMIAYAGVKALTNECSYVAIVPNNEMNMIMKSQMANINDDPEEEEDEN